MRDEFDGIGGSYAVDPKTGKRVLLERTAEKPVVASPEKDYTGEEDKEDVSEGKE